MAKVNESVNSRNESEMAKQGARKKELSRSELIRSLYSQFCIEDAANLMLEYVPMKSNVLLMDHKRKEIKTTGGLIVPHGEHLIPIGVVVAIGPDVSEDIQIGQVVHYKVYDGAEVILDGVPYVQCSENEIKGTINPNGSIKHFSKGDYDIYTAEFNKRQEEGLKNDSRARKILSERTNLLKATGKIISYDKSKK